MGKEVMVKLSAFLALLLAALDCAARALGTTPQTVFSPDHVWLWWVFAAYWSLSALAMCFAKVESKR